MVAMNHHLLLLHTNLKSCLSHLPPLRSTNNSYTPCLRILHHPCLVSTDRWSNNASFAIILRCRRYCLAPAVRHTISQQHSERPNPVSVSDFEDENGPSLQRGRKLQDAELQKLLQLHSEDDSKLDSEDDSEMDSEDDSALHSENDSELDSDNESEAASLKSKKPLKRLDFARVYNIAALRVPAEECGTLANRLRGHLLNWPRIKNVARVLGDDFDYDLKDLLWDSKERKETDVDSVRKAVYGTKETSGSVSERMQVVNKFRSQGFRYFPALERISRPKSRVKARERQEKEEPIDYRDKLYTVEVVEEMDTTDSSKEEEQKLWNGVFGTKKWIGPTRLLLLDERYAGKSVSELPMAVQALLKEANAHKERLKLKIVPCKLTLFYAYWSMEKILRELIPARVQIPSAFETVGHIAHLNLREEHLPYKRLIAQVVFDKHRPTIQSVVNKVDSIQSQFRTMQLEVLAGNHSLVTTVIEHGIPFHVNLATV